MPERRRSKTWSLWTEHRVPSEYEVVTYKLHYDFRRSPAPFELDPDAPLNRWYLTHREGSSFQLDDWEGFKDPHRLTYKDYNLRQRDREAYLDKLIDEFERGDHYQNLSSLWVETLDTLYFPRRYLGHILQMVAMYVAQMAPSAAITNCAEFQAMDEIRSVQRSAYLAKALSMFHGEKLANSDHTRNIWENHPHWQPMREVLEHLLVAYDWGEAFVALNVVVKPMCDAFFNDVVGQLARRNQDQLVYLMQQEFAVDSMRQREWTQALLAYVEDHRPELLSLAHEWAQRWQPQAEKGLLGLSHIVATAPGGVSVDECLVPALKACLPIAPLDVDGRHG